jgi:hypothetical protein
VPIARPQPLQTGDPFLDKLLALLGGGNPADAASDLAGPMAPAIGMANKATRSLIRSLRGATGGDRALKFADKAEPLVRQIRSPKDLMKVLAEAKRNMTFGMARVVKTKEGKVFAAPADRVTHEDIELVTDNFSDQGNLHTFFDDDSTVEQMRKLFK